MSKRFFHTLVTLAFAGLLFLCAAAYLPDIITVSSTPGGRELPIYCVETEKPQISISFDAACASCCLRKYGMYSPIYMGSRNVLRLDSLFLQVLTVNA